MKCPNCDAEDSYVVDSRKRKDYITRRRKCVKCGCLYLTREQVIRPCAGWAYNDKTSLLTPPQLRTWDDALWVETKSYGRNILFASSIVEFVGNYIRFENGQVRTLGLYGKQWRAWTKKPRKDDLTTRWDGDEDES